MTKCILLKDVKDNKKLKLYLISTDNTNIVGKKWGVFVKIFNNNNINIDNIIQAYRKQEVNKGHSTTNKVSKNDELSLSSTARDYQFALNAIKNVPDIRQEKVDAIKEKIRTGTYVIDAGKIAEKILENVNFDRKV